MTPEVFETLRREYHRELQAAISPRTASSAARSTSRARAIRGWTLTQHSAQLPLWLLQQYNPDLDFAELRPGTQIVMPRVEEVGAGG